MSREHILNKIKLLKTLAQSPEQNEATAANAMAEKLIEKYRVTPEELHEIAEKKAAYSDEELLFFVSEIISWKNQLALGIAHKYDCQIVQEQVFPTDGSSLYNYYVYGDDEDVGNVKFVYNAIMVKINELIVKNCAGRGPIYIHSYGEGIVSAVRQNLEFDSFDLPTMTRTGTLFQDKTISNGSANLAVAKEDKEKPTEEKVNISGQSLIKDIAAYFKGITDGSRISIKDAVHLAISNSETNILP